MNKIIVEQDLYRMSEQDHHKTIFEEYINNKKARHNTVTINRETANLFIKTIKLINRGEHVDPNLKRRINNRKFCIVQKNGEIILGQKIKNKILQVALIEDYYFTIKKFHNKTHSGICNTQATIQKHRACLPRDMIQQFIKTCPTCNLKQSQTVQPRLKPIKSENFWERVQLDLVDMRSENSNGYKWIAHAMCHFTKFHILWPMKNKSAVDVSEGLKTFVLPYFGLPKILQCDNGTEFKNQLVKELVKQWAGNFLIDCLLIISLSTILINTN